MTDDVLEAQIERLLASRYPSSLTALEIRRALSGGLSVDKKSINRVLYHRIATKGLVAIKAGTPPCWTATETLMMKLNSGSQATQATPSPRVSQVQGSAGGILQGGPSVVPTGQTTYQNQTWNGGSQNMPCHPSAMVGVGSHSPALAPNSTSQQPTLQVMQTAVGVVQPCNHVHVVPGVLAYSTGGTCYACLAEQASSQNTPAHQCQPLTNSTTSQGVSHATQAVATPENANQHGLPQGPCNQDQKPKDLEAGAFARQDQRGSAMVPNRPKLRSNSHAPVQQAPMPLHGGQQQFSVSTNHCMGNEGVGTVTGGHYMTNTPNLGYPWASPGGTGHYQMGGIPGGVVYQSQPEGYVSQGGAHGRHIMGGRTQGGNLHVAQTQPQEPIRGNTTAPGYAVDNHTRKEQQPANHGVGHSAVPLGQGMPGSVGVDHERVSVGGARATTQH